MKHSNIYALYKGDELLAFGTIKEICKQVDRAEVTIRHYATPYYQNRFRKNENTLINKLIKIEDDEDEQEEEII